MSDILYRPAELGDAPDILKLLLAVAPEIPLLVDTLEREEALYAQIRNCARSGESWLALDAAGAVVGFVLVEPDQLRRHYAEREVLELRYAAVAPSRRGAGIFRQLIDKVLARMLPISTRVSPQNRSDMARRLERLGFRLTGSAGGELRYLSEPGGTPP